MRDTLQAFADHCSNVGLLDRPAMYVRFIDIWDEPRGEIGLPDPEDIYHSAFALLCPWAMVPTLAEAQFIYDRPLGGVLEVTKVKASGRGYFEPAWQVPYSIDDRGEVGFGEPVDAPVLPQIGTAIQAVKKARMEHKFWQYLYEFDDVVPIVDGMLNR